VKRKIRKKRGGALCGNFRVRGDPPARVCLQSLQISGETKGGEGASEPQPLEKYRGEGKGTLGFPVAYGKKTARLRSKGATRRKGITLVLGGGGKESRVGLLEKKTPVVFNF